MNQNNEANMSQLSETACAMIVQVKQRQIDKQAAALQDTISRSLLDVLKRGIDIHNSSNELAGRLAKSGFRNVFFCDKENCWQAVGLSNFLRINITYKEVLDIFELME